MKIIKCSKMVHINLNGFSIFCDAMKKDADKLVLYLLEGDNFISFGFIDLTVYFLKYSSTGLNCIFYNLEKI